MGTSILGTYHGSLRLDVFRNAVADPATSVECAMSLGVDQRFDEGFSGRMLVGSPAAGCGDPGEVYAVISGEFRGTGPGIPFEIELSPAPSLRLRCVAIIVNTFPGSFFPTSSSGEEAEFSRGFACTDPDGDFLQVNLSFTGSRRP